MKNKQIKTDVTIIGGGLTGLTLALCLAEENLSIAVVEHQDPNKLKSIKADGRTSAIAYGSMQVLKQAKVWDELKNNAGAILDIRVSDNDSNLFLHYDHSLVGNEPVGYMVENHVMLKALWKKAKSHNNIQIFAPAKYEKVETDDYKTITTLQDGITINSSLLCAADGRMSKLRDIFNIEASSHDYKQQGIVLNIWHKKSHQQTAQERFLPAGPFAVLPMADQHHSSLVWTEHEDSAKFFKAMEQDELTVQIKKRIGDYLGQIKIASQIFFYPLVLKHAKTYISKRFALVGDAAHGIHPLAGQGFNLGIRDAGVLKDIIGKEFSLGMDIGSNKVLDEYNKVRKFDAISLIAITHGLNQLFSNQIAPLQTARRLGMSLVNKTLPLKKMLMKHAMGKF